MTGAALETSPRKRVWKGLSASALGYAIKAGESVILVPFFLGAWGSGLYGRWLALTALLSYLGLLDFGGQNYIANLLSIRHASGDEEGFKKDLSEGISLFLFISVVSFLVLGFALILFQFVPVPVLGRTLEQWETWVLVFVGSNFLLGVSSGTYSTCYRSAGFFARGVIVSNWFRGVWFLFSTGLLYVAVPPAAYAASILAGSLILVFVIMLDTRRNIPGCRGLAINLASARRGCAHLGGALYFWLMALAHVVKLQGVVLFLASTASPEVVAVFATHRALANIAGHTNMLVQGPIIPELSFFWAQRRFADLERATVTSIKMLMVGVGFLTLLLWISAPFVYPIWTRDRLPLRMDLLVVFLTQGVLASGWSTSTWSLLATNHHRGLTAWYLANAAVTLAFAAWLSNMYGVVGVAVAGLIGDLLCGLFVYPRLASAFLMLSPVRFYGEICLGALVLLPLAGAAYLAVSLLDGWWRVGAFLPVSAALVYLILQNEAGMRGVMKGIQGFAETWEKKIQ